MIVAELARRKYVFENGAWRGKEKPVVDMLNSLLDPNGPAGDDPDPEATIAKEVEKVGGKILERDELVYPPRDRIL